MDYKKEERIRKEITEFILWALDRGSITECQRGKSNSWIAWLEKQGGIGKINEKLKQYREYLIKETERWHKKEEDKTLSKIGRQDCIGHANAYVSARSEFENLFNYDSWLEKQGEQKHQFKPFDRVLVRVDNEDKWTCDIFSHYDYDADYDKYVYVCVSTSWTQCIPFEGNEELIGTTNEPKGGEE